jgi:hypothetical protein
MGVTVLVNRLGWRAPLIGACTVVALITTIWVLNIFVLRVYGFLPLTLDTSGPFTLKVLEMEPSAKQAGVRQDDRIDIREYAFGERFAIYSGQAPQGYRLALRLHRGGLVRQATVIARGGEGYNLAGWSVIIACYWTILLAVVISWRRPDTLLARLLVVYLLIVVAAIALAPFNLVTSSLNLNAVLSTLSDVVYAIGIAFPATLFALFALPLSRVRGLMTIATYALTLITFVPTFLIDFALTTLWLDPFAHRAPFSLPIWTHGSWAPQLAIAACAVSAVVASRGLERQRAAWVAVVIGVVLMDRGLFFAESFFPSGGSMDNILAYLGNAITILTPLGLSYAVLNRRLVDVGFVLNRAAVFTGVSLVLLTLFILGEWVLSEWFAAAHRTTSAGASLALVLVLGVFMRSIHRRVDKLVDGALFRKRHQNEMALRAFANESAFIKNLEELERQTIACVKEHTGATEVAVLLVDRKEQTYRSALAQSVNSQVPASDHAIVEMTRSRKVVDLQKTATTLVGEYAFPMFARGKLIGALICGSKPDGEVYAPDERASLAELARGVGLAIATLS